MKQLIKKLLTKTLLSLLLTTLLLTFCGCNNEESKFKGQKLNLDGYELVFFDDFNGDSLNLQNWQYRKSGRRRGGFNHPDQVSVNNGNLVFTAEYTSNKYGEGWYAGMIRTNEEFTYGYYEIRCIPNSTNDFWSAFWITHDDCYTHELSKGGVYGAEIDIFETYKNKSFTNKNFITSTIHCNGNDDDVENIDSHRVTKAYVPNLYTEYSTFGLLWTKNEYIFYVNGKETGRTSFGKGVSQVPEFVIISLEIPDIINLNKDLCTKYVVDYVKIYQIKE